MADHLELELEALLAAGRHRERVREVAEVLDLLPLEVRLALAAAPLPLLVPLAVEALAVEALGRALALVELGEALHLRAMGVGPRALHLLARALHLLAMALATEALAVSTASRGRLRGRG